MKTFYTQTELKELDVLGELLKDFTQEEKRELIIFLQGVKFAKNTSLEKEQVRGV